jgi:hydroxymethylbilane synthase
VTGRLVVGTRGSALARRQTEIVLAALRAVSPELEAELRVVRTEGDRRQEVSLEEIGGQGVFVKDIERQLIDGEIDIAVHSLKDMPAQTPAGLNIGAVLPREDARDVLVSQGSLRFDSLPHGARIGTDSRRRSAQLLALRSDLAPISIRGNVDTRVRKVDAGEYEAVVLAAAGLERLGLSGRVSQVFSVDEVLPAVGQAVLAVECRTDDAEVRELLRGLDDQATRSAITAERAFLQELGAGCRLPVAAYAVLEGDALYVRAMIASDGTMLRNEARGPPSDAEHLGSDLAKSMMAKVAP